MGYPGPLARPDTQLGRQLIEPTTVPNIPALVPRQGLRNSSGSLAIFAAIRRTSSRRDFTSLNFPLPRDSSLAKDSGHLERLIS
jgi:hypothetical protein